MLKVFFCALCALVGGVAGLYGGIWVACVWFDWGNLCGLFGFFITGPIGFVIGGVMGWLVQRRLGPRMLATGTLVLGLFVFLVFLLSIISLGT